MPRNVGMLFESRKDQYKKPNSPKRYSLQEFKSRSSETLPLYSTETNTTGSIRRNSAGDFSNGDCVQQGNLLNSQPKPIETTRSLNTMELSIPSPKAGCTNANSWKSTSGGPKNGRKRKRLRCESTDTESSASSTLERTPPDGGYGWVVVIAAFIVNMIADGVTFSFGVYFVEFNNQFNSSKSSTAWVGSLLAAMPLLSGPIASKLTDRYGCRAVTIVGGLLAAAGFAISSFAQSIFMLYFTFGVITGFGLSLCYVAAVVIVAYYFDQRRSLATGISVCGGGIGTFIFAPFTQLLIDKYQWRNATRILSAAFLNLSICGFFMKDLEWTKSMNSQKSSTPNIDLETKDKINLIKPQRLCSSAICIPTFLQEQEKYYATLQHPNAAAQQRRTQFCSPTLSFPLSNNPGIQPHSDSKLSSPPDLLPEEVKNPTTTEKPNNNKPTNATNDIENEPLNVTFSTPSNKPSQNGFPFQPKSGNLMPAKYHSGLRNFSLNNATFGLQRHSLTYRGAVLNLKRYRLRPASSCPDIISVATTDDHSTHEWKAVVSDISKWCRSTFEWKSFSNTRFLLFIISNFLLYMWYDVVYIYLSDAALQKGYSDEQSSFLISIVGLFNMIGNLTLGYMGDKQWTDTTLIYGLCMVVCGLSALLIPNLLDMSYVPLGLGCGVYGLTIAANYSLTSPILVKIVSLEKFANAYGLLLLIQGVGNLVGPPIAGLIYDWSQSSNYSFIVSGLGIILSSVFILVPKITNRSSRLSCGSEDESDDEEESN